jgi:hypothetical protein
MSEEERLRKTAHEYVRGPTQTFYFRERNYSLLIKIFFFMPTIPNRLFRLHHLIRGDRHELAKKQ